MTWSSRALLDERPPTAYDAAPDHKRRKSCANLAITKIGRAFEATSKRRYSFPSETHVKRGDRTVHRDVELIEKLGRNDLCPCGSRRLFQKLLPQRRPL
jgi:uncharacterized protein YecA (UPF0149 family)